MKSNFQSVNGKINLMLVLFLLSMSFSFAQTKVISHKSHSGSKKTFRIAYEKSLFNLNQSNFGLPGNRNIVLLDTVIAVNDSVTILKMRESAVCYPFNTSYKDLKKSDFKSKTVRINNHKIFNKKNTISTIKTSNYFGINFLNSIEEVVFVGFKK